MSRPLAIRSVTDWRFAAALEYVFKAEGVDSNHPADTGGRTRFGITEEVARAHGFKVETLTKEQAAIIYRKSYWRFDAVRDGSVAAKLFNMAVNFGPAQAIKLLQRVVGVPVDGILGPTTAAAINAVPSAELMDALCRACGDFYCDIVVNDFVKAYGKKALEKRQLSFIKGWTRRALSKPKL